MDRPADRILDERIEIAADNLRVDAATAEVFRALAAHGIESRLLKGPSIARWLYSHAEARQYRDCDLLVPPHEVEAVRAVLGRLGFSEMFEQQRMPAWWREHAGDWWRGNDGVIVDLHRTLPGIAVDDEAAWLTLAAAPETVDVAGYPAPALGLPARALHLALHAAQHGSDWHKPLADLERAAVRLPECQWRTATKLAQRLRATDAFATGLRLTGAGRDLASRLELPSRTSIYTRLRATTPPPVALGFEQLAEADGVIRRAQIVSRKLVPPVAFMRHWHPVASRGRLGLLCAYLWRPWWLLRNTPRGLRAWRSARRGARD